MSYTNLMDKQLLTVFKQLKDLTIHAEFTKKSNIRFNFGTGQVAATEDAVKIIPVIEIDAKKVKKDSSTTSKTLIGRKSDLGDLNSYDSLVLEGATWKIGTVIKGSGRIYIFEVVKNG
jgi:hypothetical protein